jgi:8-amino-7-oxononanoate synthase
MSAFSDIKTKLEARETAGLYRRRRIVDSAQSRELIVDGKILLNFCSNDYLGLAADPRVRNAFQQGANDWGVGSGASHLVNGHTRVHEELEEALAEFTGRPRALLFSSGFAANLGTISSLLSRSDHIFEDRLNHASLLDGGLISRAHFKRFPHRDYEQLRSQLSETYTESRKLIVSDAVFSMDGTICDVETLSDIAAAQEAWLMLDEAHSLGVIGEQGRGVAHSSDCSSDDVQVLIGTLGKAFGTQGGFVAGSEELIETLIQNARTYIYTTALPSAVAVATMTSLNIAIREDWRREKLTALIQRFRSGATQLGLEMIDSETAIQPLMLGSSDRATEMSRLLEDQGVMITAIRPPTVKQGSSRLRITLTAEHTEADIDHLLGALELTARNLAQ